MAGKINDGGAIYITPEVPFEEDELAYALKKPLPKVKTALATFERYNMIQRDEAGFIQITSWEKYQNIEGLDKIREQNRARQKAWYNRQKSNGDITLPNAKPNVRSNGDITLPNATEEEREEDEEKEFSFNHSIAREEMANKELSTSLSTDSPERLPVARRRMGGTLGGGVVFLSEEQEIDLLDRLTLDEFDYYVGVIRDQELAGNHYKKKTHYQAILSMAMKDRKIK
jgi:predicted phage replisome organizer